jgi:plastocyanin
MIRATLGAAVLVLALAVAACGSSSRPRSAASGVGVTIAIRNYAYEPAAVTVAPGAKITFVNHDQTSHTASSDKPGFDTGTLNSGQTATVRLDKPGTYAYGCQFHAFMRGTIVVK